MAHSEILQNKPFSILVILSNLELMDTNWKAFASNTSNVNPNADFSCKRECNAHLFNNDCETEQYFKGKALQH